MKNQTEILIDQVCQDAYPKALASLTSSEVEDFKEELPFDVFKDEVRLIVESLVELGKVNPTAVERFS